MDENKIYCSACFNEMTEGYTIHDGIYHYCSDKCLNSNISELQYKYLYEEGYAFWTTFED